MGRWGGGEWLTRFESGEESAEGGQEGGGQGAVDGIGEGGSREREMGRGATGRGRLREGRRGGGEEGARGGGISQMDINAWVGRGYRVELQAYRMPVVTMAFTDSYKHMECLCGMKLQGF